MTDIDAMEADLHLERLLLGDSTAAEQIAMMASIDRLIEPVQKLVENSSIQMSEVLEESKGLVAMANRAQTDTFGDHRKMHQLQGMNHTACS
ncbi:hypothetical protein Aduo_001596 [Ancylostoma duodenale]